MGKEQEDYEVTSDGQVYSKRSRKYLKPSVTNGYHHVTLPSGQRYIHDLVLSTFTGLRPCGLVARHLDGDKANNRWDNLVWDTQAANLLDKRDHLTVGHRLNEQCVKVIKHMSHISSKVLAKHHGVSVSTIRHIRSGRTWSWV